MVHLPATNPHPTLTSILRGLHLRGAAGHGVRGRGGLPEPPGPGHGAGGGRRGSGETGARGARATREATKLRSFFAFFWCFFWGVSDFFLGLQMDLEWFFGGWLWTLKLSLDNNFIATSFLWWKIGDMERFVSFVCEGDQWRNDWDASSFESEAMIYWMGTVYMATMY